MYLHLDPRTPITAADVLPRQRMDFLLLLPDHHRVVIELDGKQHYSTADGQASPTLYGEMMAEDRRIRLAGYEVYRFGGAELNDPDVAGQVLRQFFLDLFAKHGIDTKAADADRPSSSQATASLTGLSVRSEESFEQGATRPVVVGLAMRTVKLWGETAPTTSTQGRTEHQGRMD